MSAAELEGRRQALEEALARAERASGGVDHAALREQIVGLFRDAQAEAEKLAALRDSVRPLAERYRSLQTRAAAGPAANRAEELATDTHLERGWSALAEGDHALAETEVARALAVDPARLDAAALLAWAQVLQGKVGEAAATVDALVDRAPRHALGWAVAGLVRLHQGDPAGAVEDLSRALRARPDRKTALYANLFLGMVYIERGIHRDARLFLARALDLGPNLIEAHWEIGRSHYLEGDHTAALEAWKRGSRQNRFNAWGERCARAAAELEAGGAASLR